MSKTRNIVSIAQLISELGEAENFQEYKNLVKRLNIPSEEFANYAYWSDEKYTRNCIDRTDDHELILLCWEAGQETPIHCHNEQECWVIALMGEFEEKRFIDSEEGIRIIDVERELAVKEQGVSYMNDDMGYHALKNISDSRAMSLHLYVSPIDECTVYRDTTNSFERIKLEYDSFKGRVVVES